MSDPIEFLFDFSSPYGYVAAHRIEEIGQKHEREVIWKPFLLGAIFQVNDQRPLKDQALKWDYSSHDLSRTARHYGVKWTLPEIFPIPTQAAGRAFYWINDQDRGLAKKFALAAYQKYFADGVDIRPKEVIAEVATGLGLDGAACLAAMEDDVYKLKLKEVTAEAIERNVCGSPFFFIGDEPFWGNDRLDMIDEWLETGGW
ncbi:MAG: 2-hydroxychromene-2-carboxylate isomerase [Rhodospirillaceae bacterium]|jgi:2-hydroxychromene-2-carboxylate isomerase|nr:2-hydroxychromene-2-carboxylate isomerase [Rhodospirillaceae bacterium]MBT5939007.1 2-hydroxychromene-2-carboxylate isomerase [Rhodospirillaceae bacterium]MBT7266726.1 2-hydroxychromene-2-carboxylate isomerase [Rhodospirillaceae bacterium]